MRRSPAIYRPMTRLELERAKALGHCRFSVGSFDKRFARDICTRALTLGTISEKQATLLERKCWSYRRQLPPLLVPAKPKVEHRHP